MREMRKGVNKMEKLYLDASTLEAVDCSITTKVTAEVYFHYAGNGWTAMADNSNTLFIYPECGFDYETCTLKWSEWEGYVYTRDDDEESVYRVTFLDLDDEQVPVETRKELARMLGWDDDEDE